MFKYYEYCNGSIFDDEAEVLVNPTNAMGISGAGLALEFRKRYPTLNAAYRKWLETELRHSHDKLVGSCFFYQPAWGELFKHKTIACCATKDRPENKSQLIWVQACLDNLQYQMGAFKKQSVAVPALGCGLGGLPWDSVHNVIKNFARRNKNSFEVHIYPPQH